MYSFYLSWNIDFHAARHDAQNTQNLFWWDIPEGLCLGSLIAFLRCLVLTSGLSSPWYDRTQPYGKIWVLVLWLGIQYKVWFFYCMNVNVRLAYEWLGGLNPVLSSDCIQTSCLQEAYACSGKELQSRISFQSVVLLLYGC